MSHRTAQQDAADFGTGFEVDGRRVAPERVRVFGATIAPDWHPIETAPKDGTRVDLWLVGPRNSGARRADCWFASGSWWCDALDRGDLDPAFYVGDVPTHWMPIPTGPEPRG